MKITQLVVLYYLTGNFVIPCVRLSVGPSVRLCPSVHPEWRYHFNSLRILGIGLKFGGIMHSTMKQIANGHTQPILRVLRNFEISMIGLDQVWGMMTHILWNVRKSFYGLKFGGRE